MRPELEMSQLKELLKVITPMTLVMVLNLTNVATTNPLTTMPKKAMSLLTLLMTIIFTM